MIIIDDRIINQKIELSKDFKDMTEQLASEVDEFFMNFEDCPCKRSAWGHHYFCREDGNVLQYNPQHPHSHVCPICNKIYSSPLLDGAWIYIYRNEAALTVLKSAILYKVTKKRKYLDITITLAGYYIFKFEQFELHNKEGHVFDNLETMKWGCGRIMPQNLNESIFFIRIFSGLELIRNELPNDLLEAIKTNFSISLFNLLKPQVDKIHNISCWMNCAIGVIGLFCGNESMIDFAFEGNYNINRQLCEGVTEDGFWYEGSIHYNFFTLEGIIYLALFAKACKKEFRELKIVQKMLVSAYKYAFSNQQLPNPNDGWPDINLKSYSYIYSVGTKVFGYDSEVGKILSRILTADYTRGEVPLSKPYYFDNRISLEQFLFVPDFDCKAEILPDKQSMDFEKSNYALLKGNQIDVFFKYGHNGPSHAHPDKMTIEVIFGKKALSRDLSNSGYGSIICNQWHRVSASHNTVVVDGMNHTSFAPGKKLGFSTISCIAEAENVYEDVSFTRNIVIAEKEFHDEFKVVSGHDRNYDFIFHAEAELNMELSSLFEVNRNADLGYKDSGYAYFKNVADLKPLNGANELVLKWKLGQMNVVSSMDINDTEVFIAKSPANPVTSWRTSIILRRKAKQTIFHMNWKLI